MKNKRTLQNKWSKYDLLKFEHSVCVNYLCVGVVGSGCTALYNWGILRLIRGKSASFSLL